MQSGKFIVLEGIDGCGKTTVAKLLAPRLKALVTREPTSIGAGRKIHNILRHRVKAPSPLEFQKLYIADRGEHLKRVITPALAQGKNVICQRYSLSTFAFGMAFGVAYDDLKHRVPKPDVTFLLDLPAKEAMKRIAKRNRSNEYFEKTKKLEKVRRQYRLLAKRKEFGEIVVLNALQTPRMLISQIDAVLSRRS
ncbi:MAG: dTMP kinase [Patescibacteria group bacterium]